MQIKNVNKKATKKKFKKIQKMRKIFKINVK